MLKDLETKLLKAKIELMTRSVFISTIALSVRHIITTATKTADVCETTIRYNPDFIKNLSIPQFAGLIAHECWHLAFQHNGRKGGRKPITWNAAGDYVINNLLVQANIELPPDGLIDKKYDDTWSTEAVYDDLIDQNKDFDPCTMMLDLIDGESSEEPVLNSGITDVIIRARTQARMSDDSAGSLPGEIERIIDKLLNPKLPWPVILNKFLDQRTREEYSWARRNRRYHSAYMPSLYSYGLSHLTFAIDTSGSRNDGELQNTLSEIRGIQQIFNPEKMTIIDCDARIHNIYTITQSTDILSLKFHGGGGTKFQPVLDYVDKHPTQALVYFTDLYGEEELDKVDYPILWICNSKHEPMNIGETVYVD